MEQPLVTVVTPSYNQAPFLRATIESVLSQDYPRIEYIIMDGGSEDASAQIASEYSSRLSWFSGKDRGQSHALNKGYRMAKGDILAWINSDDILLDGAVRRAVEGFRDHPLAGAVYGEGFLMDRDGNFTSRFPYVRPFDLWSLVHLSDYVLQQSMYFRADVYREIGEIREDLHYTMDWDLLIRIGKRYPLQHLPHYMGCLREHDEAKTFRGGGVRIREIGRMLREHTGMWMPPGLVHYGMDMYRRIWCDRIAKSTPAGLSGLGEFLQLAVTYAAGIVARRITSLAWNSLQGWYEDGWVSTRILYMLPACDSDLIIEGELPPNPWLAGQNIEILCNGVSLGSHRLPKGAFRLQVPARGLAAHQPANLELRASHYYIPTHFGHLTDRRRLAYKIKRITWSAYEGLDLLIHPLGLPSTNRYGTYSNPARG
ncbi:MAG: glycosyltransferase [Acidobacteriia bacterium]|nr:glycosyltransferase [Terriglobia bacterium]